MGEYLRSTIYDEKLLRDVLALDALVYPPDFQGTFASVKHRFKAYPEMFIYRYDKENNLIGYICFFPISTLLQIKIKNSNFLFDDNITHNEIVNGPNNPYLVISIAVSKKHQREKVATKLMREMILTLKKNNYPLTIYAYTINQESEKLFKNFSFKTLKKISNIISLQSLQLNNLTK